MEPPGDRWAGLIRTPPGDAVTRSTRATLGLPPDRPVVMGGHQPGFWHAGILAKWMAVKELARATASWAAWVVVDQSAGAELAYPAQRGGRLERRTLRLGDAETPTAAQRAVAIEAPADIAPGAHAGIALAARLLEARQGEASLAAQLRTACEMALGELGLRGEGSMIAIFASALNKTGAFAELVGAMRADPIACARLYNEAVRAHPGADVRELESGSDGTELPMWEITEAGPWRPIRSDRLADLPDERLALRALPMTGLLRRWACDLFVHGTGGGASGSGAGYDRVTERWLEAWLGWGVGEGGLAPAVVATATVTLGRGALGVAGDPPTPREIAEARAAAHRAEHDPSLLGAPDLGERKRELAQRIAALPRGSAERDELFAEMQRLRAEGASEHRGELERLRARAAELESRAAESEVASDRAWPFVLHEPGALARLRDCIARELGA